MTSAHSSAFPFQEIGAQAGAVNLPEWGLTKREYFAAVALQGLLACPHQMCNDIENQSGLAVEYADRLLAELAK